jgi:hypothetical protein
VSAAKERQCAMALGDEARLDRVEKARLARPCKRHKYVFDASFLRSGASTTAVCKKCGHRETFGGIGS